jgi:hypothetical protein
MRNFTVFLSAAVKGRTMGYTVHVILIGRWDMEKKKPVSGWHESAVWGGGLDSCGSGYGCVILNTKETSGNMKGDEVDQLSDYQLMNNESALRSYSTFQQLSWLFIWGKSSRKATPTKTGMLAEEISHLPFCLYLSLLCYCSYSDNMAAAMDQSL